MKGCEVIWENDPSARILHCDPLIHAVAPSDQPSLEEIAFKERQAQFDAWDMLCGLKEPQLGGKPHFLDLIGVNYYHKNQWETGGELLCWHLDHPLRIPLNKLLLETYERYKRPLLLAETSHVDSEEGRGLKTSHSKRFLLNSRINILVYEKNKKWPIAISFRFQAQVAINKLM